MVLCINPKWLEDTKDGRKIRMRDSTGIQRERTEGIGSRKFIFMHEGQVK